MTVQKRKKKERSFKKFYRDKSKGGKWRWQAKSGNYKITANCGEGYENLADAQHGLKVTLHVLAFGRTIIEGKDDET